MVLVILLSFTVLAYSMPADLAAKVPTNRIYDDNFARNIMYPLSAAAYSTTPQSCLTNVLGATIRRKVDAHCDTVKSDTCSGYTATSDNDKAIILVFRGTTTFFQLVSEVNDGIFQKKIAFIGGGNVNEYFYDAFVAVWNAGVKFDLLDLHNKNPDYEIWVTGHSLGASMASIAASFLVNTGLISGDKIKLVTFGQPRTGDKAFAQMHDQSFPYSYRVTHNHDTVPHVPLELMGYEHHKSEVFFKADMSTKAKFTECDADESSKCSDANWTDLSIGDHLEYYNKHILDYGNAGCVGS